MNESSPIALVSARFRVSCAGDPHPQRAAAAGTASPLIHTPAIGVADCPASKRRDQPLSHAEDVFDQARIDELRSVLGEVRFERLLGLLMAECRERPPRLREGLCRGDLACVRAEAHRLFGAATSIGACALGDAAIQLETARALVSAVPLLEELERAARDTLGAAQVMLSRFDGKRAHA